MSKYFLSLIISSFFAGALCQASEQFEQETKICTPAYKRQSNRTGGILNENGYYVFQGTEKNKYLRVDIDREFRRGFVSGGGFANNLYGVSKVDGIDFKGVCNEYAFNKIIKNYRSSPFTAEIINNTKSHI